MAIAVDIAIVVLVGLAVYAEARRGLFLALVDVARVALGVAAGLGASALVHALTRDWAAALAAFCVAGISVAMTIPWLVARSGIDPRWGRVPAARTAAGVIGLALGLAICMTLVPVAARLPGFAGATRSPLARPFLDQMPRLYRAADVLGVELPALGSRARRFEDEAAGAALVGRINYSRLDGSTCIECRGRVRFRGYHRRFEVAVSPLFRCPECGRTSDGCQAFEGFHRMYDRCPTTVADELGPIDCGVWPNNRPVVPRGACPVCGRSALRH